MDGPKDFLPFERKRIFAAAKLVVERFVGTGRLTTNGSGYYLNNMDMLKGFHGRNFSGKK
jgi:hypothetical protein